MSGPTWLGHHRIERVSCTSTSDLALGLARSGAAHGTIVVAGAQTAGRGRLGRVWASPPGRHLYLSAVVRCPRPLLERSALTLAVGVGLVDAVRAAGAGGAALKWPNDVVVAGKKLAGVLCEAAGDAIVVGIGVNLAAGTDDLPPEVAARATTVEDAAGSPVERAGFERLLLGALEPWLDRFAAGGPAAIVGAWTARMAADLPLAIEQRGRRITGSAIGLDPDGALRLRGDDGVVHRVVAGEVTIAVVPPA